MKKFSWLIFSLVVSGMVIATFPSVTRASSTDSDSDDSDTTQNENVTITSYHIKYYLGKDKNNHSTLKTTETIEADFSGSGINHGIERYIPILYDHRSVQLNMQSITDEKGNKLPYTSRIVNGNRIYRIGDKNVYVQGRKTYVLTYTQTNVTKYFSDANVDEFYWDTNGTGWASYINELLVDVTLDPTISRSLTGKIACYDGEAGSTDPCQQLEKQGNTISVHEDTLFPGDNVTLAVGFHPHTFAAYAPNLLDILYLIWLQRLWYSLAIGLLLAVLFLLRYNFQNNRTRELGTIVPEYVPPKNTSIITSSAIYNGKTKSPLAAQLIDFAVRGYIKLQQTRAKGVFHAAEYTIEVVKNIDDLLDEEKQTIKDMFNEDCGVGSSLRLSTLRYSESYRLRRTASAEAFKPLLFDTYKLVKKDKTKSKWFYTWAIVLVLFAAVTLSPLLLIPAVVAVWFGSQLTPLTDEGLALRRYLKGLKLYISVAEEQRLKVLQSVSGAQMTPIDTNNPTQLVELYERLLPYAVLFGKEKSWNQQLGKYYETSQSQPDWYIGDDIGLFNAAALDSVVGSFTSATSYASPGDSSSSGSSGGGSSGGGGGGGGGGGW